MQIKKNTPGLAFTGRSMPQRRPGYTADWNAARVLGVTAGETALLTQGRTNNVKFTYRNELEL